MLAIPKGTFAAEGIAFPVQKYGWVLGQVGFFPSSMKLPEDLCHSCAERSSTGTSQTRLLAELGFGVRSSGNYWQVWRQCWHALGVVTRIVVVGWCSPRLPKRTWCYA